MRELVDADSASVPAASTGGDAPQQREIASRGTVPAAAKLGHRRGKRGTRSEESKNARRSHVSKQKSRLWRSRGVAGVLHPTGRTEAGT